MKKSVTNPFKPGDVVRLRCGGPAMVIARRATKPSEFPGITDLSVFHEGWEATWMNQRALRRATFADDELELVPQTDDPKD